MRRAIHSVGRIIGGLVVLVGSFWITLVILDRSNSVDGQVANRSQSNAVFSLTIQGTPNWSAATPETTTKVLRDGIIVQSTIATGGYEFATKEVSLVKTSPTNSYVLEYDITASQGAVAVGVLDTDSDRWISTYPIVQRRGRHEFSTQAKSIRLIVYNNGSGPSLTTIARLALTLN